MTDIAAIVIEKIRLGGGTQSRALINQFVVDEYAEAMKDGASFPPVTLFYDGADYWLGDGFHRVHAAMQLGKTEIEADVKQGTRRDAVLYSVGANSTHGLKRTNADKRRAVETLLSDEEWSKWSDREIARRCGVSNQFVSNIRPHCQPLTVTDERTYTTKHGTTTTMKTTNIRQQKPIVPVVRSILRDTPIADKPEQLETLAKLPQEKQVVVAEKIISGEAKDVREAVSLVTREKRVAEIVTKNTPAIGELGTFPVIYADPPWRYEHVRTESRAIENHYPTMALEDICGLPVGEIAADDCVLFMWATNPKLAEATEVISKWGFSYRTNLAWVKDRIGKGYYARSKHELLLVAVRGTIPVPMVDDRFESVIYAPRTEHSKKPVEFYELIERMYPEYRKVELFSRNVRDGWFGWGNQYDNAA